MSSSESQFQKAILLLDRGDFVQGETFLRTTLRDAEAEGDRSLIASVRCCLAELLLETNRRPEAVPIIRPVAGLDEYDDLVAHERNLAIELFRRAGEA